MWIIGFSEKPEELLIQIWTPKKSVNFYFKVFASTSNYFHNIFKLIYYNSNFAFAISFPLKSSYGILPNSIFKIQKLISEGNILSIYVSYNGSPSVVFDFDKGTSLSLFLKITKYRKTSWFWFSKWWCILGQKNFLPHQNQERPLKSPPPNLGAFHEKSEIFLERIWPKFCPNLSNNSPQRSLWIQTEPPISICNASVGFWVWTLHRGVTQ